MDEKSPSDELEQNGNHNKHISAKDDEVRRLLSEN